MFAGFANLLMGSGFLGATSELHNKVLLLHGSSRSILLLLWQLESGLATGTITGERVSSSSGSRTYFRGASSDE